MTPKVQRLVDRYTRYVLADVCPNPFEHDRLMGQREQTWREPVRHGATDRCPWCGGRLP